MFNLLTLTKESNGMCIFSIDAFQCVFCGGLDQVYFCANRLNDCSYSYSTYQQYLTDATINRELSNRELPWKHNRSLAFIALQEMLPKVLHEVSKSLENNNYQLSSYSS